MTFIAQNTFLWQKLAVELNLSLNVDDVAKFLHQGVNILYLRCSLHTKQENEQLLDMANEAIGTYCTDMNLGKPAIGVACELSGKVCRLKFDRKWGPVEVVPGQKIYLTSDNKYEDRRVDSIMYVTNFERQLNTSNPGEVLNINGIKMKICKIKGKFMHCCVTTIIGSSSLLHPYDPVTNICPDKSLKLTDTDKEECLLAIKKNCHYVVVPDVQNHMIIHALDELLQMHSNGGQIIRTIARLASSDSCNDPCVTHNIQHVAGCITQDVDVVKQCKEYCRVVLFEIENLDKLPGEEIYSQVDVFITKPNIVEALQFRLREINQSTLRTLMPFNYSVQLEQGQRVLGQCIEYASTNCQANAVIFCTPNALCEAEKLSRRSLPCPVLVTTDNEDALYYLLLRKYCFPILVCGRKSKRHLIKYATIYGRKFGFLKPGNFVVTGFDEHFVQGMELRYVPDDFVSGVQ